jgi:hypothetical protein
MMMVSVKNVLLLLVDGASLWRSTAGFDEGISFKEA